MNIIAVDDEMLVLKGQEIVLRRVMPDAEIHTFHEAKAALDYAKEQKVDVAFLDINMRILDGLTLARELQTLNPVVNIIFCTGYGEYAIDAHKLYASGYLMKPVSEEAVREALSRLRYKVEEGKRLQIKCFGNFEVLLDGSPLVFKYNRTKELLAYLVDRRGVYVSTRELMSVLFDRDNVSYFSNLRLDLLGTFKEAGIEDTIRQSRGMLGLDVTTFDCDYYDYLEGKGGIFIGEYMSQYSFAERTLGFLLSNRIKNN
ncbi:MAG: response regulator [Spirochaetales bacterium]|nr:response regulator [Candidatus Physcosoma equi]